MRWIQHKKNFVNPTTGRLSKHDSTFIVSQFLNSESNRLITGTVVWGTLHQHAVSMYLPQRIPFCLFFHTNLCPMIHALWLWRQIQWIFYSYTVIYPYFHSFCLETLRCRRSDISMMWACTAASYVAHLFFKHFNCHEWRCTKNSEGCQRIQ